MRFEVSEKEFFYMGLLQCNHAHQTIKRTCKQTNLDRFKDAYYATPKTLHDIFIAIQDPDLGDKQIKKPKPTQLLTALRFLKKYPTKHALAGITGRTEKTALLQVWKYVQAIQALKEQKIVWVFDDTETYSDTLVCTVDGVHFRIWEPRKFPSTSWYSPKYKKAALAYEIALSMHHNKIVWVNGPFPAGENDKKIFDKEGGLASKLKAGQSAIGDEGYKGNPKKVQTRNSMLADDDKDIMRRAKARQETVNTRLKSFGVLNQPFRSRGQYRLPRHKCVMEACLVVIQYEIDNGSFFFRI